MKRFLIQFCLIFSVFAFSQNAEIVVQAGHSSFMSGTKLDETRNRMVTYGGFDDKVLKIWDTENGTLLKSIVFEENAHSIDIDKVNGKIFLGFETEIVVYDIQNYKKLNAFKVENCRAIGYSVQDGNVYLITGQYDQGASFHKINPINGTISTAGATAYPSDGLPISVEMLADGRIFKFYTEYQETFFYEISSGQFFPMQNPPEALFNNFNMIYFDYIDATHVKVVRYDAVNQKDMWERVIVTEKRDNDNQITDGQVSITPDEKSVWVAPGKSTLIELNAETGEVMGVIYNKNKKSKLISDNSFVYAQEVPQGEFFLKGRYIKFSRYKVNPIAQFGHLLHKNVAIDFNQSGQQVDIAGADLNNRLYSLSANVSSTQMTEYQVKSEKSYANTKININPAKNQLLVSKNDKDQGIETYAIGKSDSYKKTVNYNQQFVNVDFNAAADHVALLGENKLWNYNIITNQVASTVDLQDITRLFQTSDVLNSFSSNGNEFSVIINDEEVFDAQYERRLDYYDFVTQSRRWTKPGEYLFSHITKDGKYVYAANLSSKNLEIINTTNGNIERTIALPIEHFGYGFFVTPDDKKVVFSGYDTKAHTVEINQNRVVSQSKFNTEINGVINNKMYYRYENNYITIFDIDTHQELLNIYLFADNEWVAATPTGQFDGSQEGWKRVVFVDGKNTIPLDQVFEQFYTPRLIYKILNQETIDKKDIKKLKEAPEVEIYFTENTRNLLVEDDTETIETKSEKAKITLKANLKGSTLSEFRLFHNEKLVGNTRNLVVEDDVLNEKVYEINLIPGENQFRALVLNSEGTESRSEQLFVNYKAESNEIPKPQGIQVYMLVIGINEYKNPKYNLNYAVADATSFKEKLSQGMQEISSAVNATTIFNSNANKTEILSNFQNIIDKANPQDIFIFYYAGHGVMTQDDSKEFYIVPFDVTQLYGADDGLRAKGFSANELKELAAKIPAQKQLYILDACQSAGALDVVSVRGAAEEKAIAQLARSTGTHWLTASGSEQFATEFDELGHGVFTYVLLDALSGKADSGDGRITVNELKAYIESQVPEVSGKYKGSPQYPASFGFGQDFPIGVAK